MTLLIQIAVTAAVVLVVILMIRWLLGRGRVGNLLDEAARKMILRSLTLLAILGGVLAVVATNNTDIADQLTDGIVSFLPQAVVGGLILLTAVVLGRLVGVLVAEVLRERSPLMAARAGKLLTLFIIVIGSILAADQFGITTDLIMLIIGAALAAVALATALAFGLGAVPVVSQIAAGRHVDNRFEVGDTVNVGEISGVLTSIGIASSRVESAEGAWEVPNSSFLESAIRIGSPSPSG